MIKIDLQKIQLLKEFVNKAKNIVITTHLRPDGDALGSSLGIYHFLKALGKSSRLVLNDRWPDTLKFMFTNFSEKNLAVYDEDALKAESWLEEADLIFCMDFNDFHRAEKLEPFLTNAKAKKILIDHHLNPEESLFDLVFSKIDISSAAELTYHILMHTSVIGNNVHKLPINSARALMTGMITDTNNFANSVYPSTYNMASSLLEAGVDRDKLISKLYHKQSENRIRLMAYLLLNKLTITNYGVAYMILDKETIKNYNIEEGETEGFVNIPLSIAKVKMSIFAKDDGDSIRISIRSKEGVSANDCARIHFNGGGHELASGGKLNIGYEIDNIVEVGTYIERCTAEFMNNK